jgi:hypothetical protein
MSGTSFVSSPEINTLRCNYGIDAGFSSMKAIKAYLASLVDPEFAPAALKVALVVGSLLFAINHGAAFVNRQMNSGRWVSVVLTYIVPYCVSVHGQFTQSTLASHRQRHDRHKS